MSRSFLLRRPRRALSDRHRAEVLPDLTCCRRLSSRSPDRAGPDQALEWAAASLGAALFRFVALIVYPKGMGMGDVKLALLLGAGLGRYVMVGLMGACWALPPAIVLFARHGSKARTMAIPFGPFLAFGAIVAFFFGQENSGRLPGHVLRWLIGNPHTLGWRPRHGARPHPRPCQGF